MARMFVIVVAVVMAGAADAWAQSAYVSASLIGDILRVTHTETDGGAEFNAGGEGMGMAIRVGTRIGSSWGVEAEWARGSEIETEQQPDILPFVRSTFGNLLPGPATGVSIPSDARAFAPFTARTSQEQMTLTAAAWIAQQLSSRLALVYTGGASFYQSEQEFEFEVPRRLSGLPLAPLVFPPVSTETTTYGVRPMVGIESRVTLTDRVNIAGGIRLHAGDNLWLVRPSVGVGWTF